MKSIQNVSNGYKKIQLLIVVIMLIITTVVFTGCGKSDDDPLSQAGLKFVVHDVNNDHTGNWRISTISQNVQMQDYALDYYKKYFKNDKEIHAIVNFNYNTTTQISVIGNLLDVSVYEYVDKEEHDANLLFSGKLLTEYHVDKDTGEIEEI